MAALFRRPCRHGRQRKRRCPPSHPRILRPACSATPHRHQRRQRLERRIAEKTNRRAAPDYRLPHPRLGCRRFRPAQTAPPPPRARPATRRTRLNQRRHGGAVRAGRWRFFCGRCGQNAAIRNHQQTPTHLLPTHRRGIHAHRQPERAPMDTPTL